MPPDPTLHGNGQDCPACALQREATDPGAVLRPVPPCNLCGGRGRLAFTAAQIIETTTAEARRTHWPAFDARNSKE